MDTENTPLDDKSYGWDPIFCSSLREAYYDIIDKVPNKRWKEFARTGLGIEESVIDNICHDAPNNIREQQFQMCRKWGEMECVDDGEVDEDDEDQWEILTNTVKYLYQILNYFLLEDRCPKPERKKLSKRKRFKRNYCYRVSRVVINNGHAGKTFLSRYGTSKGSREVVIFNNTFTHSNKFLRRLGTEFDVENMKNLWQKVGCRVKVHTDFTAVDMTNELKNYAAMWRDIDYCVVIIMSHGDKGDIIYGESYKAEDFVCARDIVDIFSSTNAESLAGIPKLFFFECSRGGKVGATDLSPIDAKARPRPIAMRGSDFWDMPSVDLKRSAMKIRSRSFTIESPVKEEESSSFGEFPPLETQNPSLNEECPSPDYNIPPLSDMLMCFSTAPGYSAFRDPRNGSWFINAVTNVFMTHASQQHVVNLMIKVGEAMSERTASKKIVEGEKCISHFECTLKKELYLAQTPATSSDIDISNTKDDQKPATSSGQRVTNSQETGSKEQQPMTRPTSLVPRRAGSYDRSTQTDHLIDRTPSTAIDRETHALKQTLVGVFGGLILTVLYRFIIEIFMD